MQFHNHLNIYLGQSRYRIRDVDRKEVSRLRQPIHDQLNLIEEKRVEALCHGQLYQQRMKKAYDKKVRPRQFQEGDRSN